MLPIKTSVFAALAAAILTAGALYYFNQSRAHEAAVLRRDNNRMRMQVSQRPRVRPVTPVASAPRAPHDSAATAPVVTAPVENHRNAGQATPHDALNTFAWACDHGDTETVGSMLYFDPAAREMAEGILAGLPDNERAKFKTVDEMAAAMITANSLARPFPHEAILNAATIEPLAEDRAKFRLPGTARDGLELQRTADGWKYAITEAMVQAYLKNLRAR